jgi:hypothetical protein
MQVGLIFTDHKKSRVIMILEQNRMLSTILTTKSEKTLYSFTYYQLPIQVNPKRTTMEFVSRIVHIDSPSEKNAAMKLLWLLGAKYIRHNTIVYTLAE